MFLGISGDGQLKQTDGIIGNQNYFRPASGRKAGRDSARWADTGKIAGKVSVYPKGV